MHFYPRSCATGAVLAREFAFVACLPKSSHLRSGVHSARAKLPRAIVLSFRDYVRLAALEPEALTIIGEESKAKGTDALTSQQMDGPIRAATRTPGADNFASTRS